MNVDLGSFAFGSYLNSGAGTPSWGTALGQSRPDYKFTYPGAEVLLIGMVYCSVPLDRVSLPLGKGGHIYQASELEECQLASLFRKVYINGTKINYPFVMVLIREESDSHAGRRSVKYSDKNSYQFNGERFSNQEFINQARRALNLADDACWFVYSIEVYNQDELHMSAVIVDDNNSVSYENSSERKNKWLELIPDSGGDAFNSKSSRTNIIERLQQIYYGAPGTGKSHEIKEKTEGKIVVRTTFHPDSDYSTFVGCYKPSMNPQDRIYSEEELAVKLKEIKNSGVTYPCHKFAARYWRSLKDLSADTIKQILIACGFTESMNVEISKGVAIGQDYLNKEEDGKIIYSFTPQAFTNAYTAAWNTTEDIYLIIEEINRGNCAQIFGDLFQLLDRGDDGFSEYPVDADKDLGNFIAKELENSTRTDFPDGVKDGKKLVLPSNLYIWATMNTSDQSLFPIDSAFKRRWDWKYMKIRKGRDENGNELDWKIVVKDKDKNIVKINNEDSLSWWDFIEKINDIIASMTSSADKQLGYFFCKADEKANETDKDFTVISANTFVSKVLFYLWNDVFKDYGFEDASLFRYKETIDGKETEKDLTFPDFYDEDGENVNSTRVVDFVQKVMNWKKKNEENN